MTNETVENVVTSEPVTLARGITKLGSDAEMKTVAMAVAAECGGGKLETFGNFDRDKSNAGKCRTYRLIVADDVHDKLVETGVEYPDFGDNNPALKLFARIAVCKTADEYLQCQLEACQAANVDWKDADFPLSRCHTRHSDDGKADNPNWLVVLNAAVEYCRTKIPQAGIVGMVVVVPVRQSVYNQFAKRGAGAGERDNSVTIKDNDVLAKLMAKLLAGTATV